MFQTVGEMGGGDRTKSKHNLSLTNYKFSVLAWDCSENNFSSTKLGGEIEWANVSQTFSGMREGVNEGLIKKHLN